MNLRGKSVKTTSTFSRRRQVMALMARWIRGKTQVSRLVRPPTAYGSRKSPRRVAPRQPRRFMYGDLRAHISRGGRDAIVVYCSAHHCTLALTCTRVGVRTVDQLSASCAAGPDQSVTRIAARRGAHRLGRRRSRETPIYSRQFAPFRVTAETCSRSRLPSFAAREQP